MAAAPLPPKVAAAAGERRTPSSPGSTGKMPPMSPCAPARPPRICRPPRSPASRRPTSTSAGGGADRGRARLLRVAVHRPRDRRTAPSTGSTTATWRCRSACRRWCGAISAPPGVIFTLDTESGFRDVVLVTGAWGLGETVVQGRVAPGRVLGAQADARAGHRPILRREIAEKGLKLVYADGGGEGGA